MKRLSLAAGLALVVVVPAAAAKEPTRQHARVYARTYRQVAHELGKRAPGRNILRDGLASGAPVSDRQLTESIGVLERMLAPPPRVVSYPTSPPPTTSSAPAAASAPATSSGGYTIPSSIVQCESGGNYRAVNPSSGAGGAYQILPSTWAAYGGSGLPQDASPAEQGAIAAKIWAAQGASAWSC